MESIFEHRDPPPELKPYIRQVMVTHNEQPLDFIHHAWPSGYSFIHYIHRGLFDALVDGRERVHKPESVFIAGVIDKQDIVVSFSGKYSQIVSEFTALGAYQLTGLLGSVCQGDTFDVNLFPARIKKRCREFIAQCREQGSQLTSYDCLPFWFDFLIDLSRQPFETLDYLSDAIAKIEQAKGLVKLNELCEEVGVSERQLNREFSKTVGISPKYFARILQINYAMQCALTEDRDYFAMIAAKSGYYDESHFIKAAKGFFKQPPTEFLSSEQDVWFEFIRYQKQIK